jgi:transposase-like protein
MEEIRRRRLPRYDPETKAGAVALCRAGRTQQEVAKSLGCCDRQVRRWVRQADIDDKRKPGLTSSERRELTLLRRANVRLEQRALLLEEALDFFALETR